MKHKNAWNKEFQTKTIKDEKDKKRRLTTMIRNGAKNSELENRFASVVKHMKYNKFHGGKKNEKDSDSI